MTDSDGTLYCALASNSVSFGANGHARPCCAIDTNAWSYNDYLTNNASNLDDWYNNIDLVQVRTELNYGRWPDACKLCRIREESGQPSTRQVFNKTLFDLEQKTERAWRDHRDEITDFDNIFLLDVTVGNKCNSSCLMCNPSASDMWQKEQEEILGRKIDWHGNNWLDEDNAVEIVKKLPNLRALQFVGGEPTVNKPHLEMLEYLVETGRSKDITLGYVVNLTAITEKLVDLWNHFDKKYITISVDGLGPVNEYIRYPFSWDKVTRGLDRIIKQAHTHGNYNIGLSHTVISLNILRLDEILEWWEDKIASSDIFIPGLPHVQCVTTPSHFDPVYMPEAMKEQCRQTLDRFASTMEARGLLHKYMPVINNIKNNILDVSHPESERIVEWMTMQDFCEKTDKHRGRNIFDYLPYMKEHWLDTDMDLVRFVP